MQGNCLLRTVPRRKIGLAWLQLITAMYAWSDLTLPSEYVNESVMDNFVALGKHCMT